MNKKLYQLFGSKSADVVKYGIMLFETAMIFNPTAAQRETIRDCIGTLYSLAKYAHCRIEWDGNCSTCCQPDKFSIYKNGVKYDFLADSLIYDGVAAKAYHISKSV